MDLTLEIQELSSYLDDNKKKQVLEVIKDLLQDGENLEDDLDFDLHFIDLAEQEYAKGETISHNERNWK